ncbi:thioesterase II family protein [Mycobacterium sp. TY815]|uniref:thioesterase II family protein n=1 Tax=Mycobacterium sp. TY815 TaxID=3050581 RepID=UPI002742241D|nr:alpha/beta fold hydrolase [Mycobacterium sp. TY815]MDP7707261.1 alpha/beta fold hydrolase [Mycobacterium sp. TY815]
MPRTLGWIRQFHQPDSPESPTLLIFPHAGAGASAYRSFSKALSRHFRVLVFQYPGRQDRAAEPPLTSLPEIAAGAFEEFVTSEHRGSGPVVAFGHSMGGWVAFEFVRIAESRGIDVRELYVSAAVAPGNAVTKPPHPTDDESILNHLTALEGTNSAVFGNRDLMRLALPVIKADYRACDAYTCSDDVTISAQIHALGGDQDPIVTLGDLYGWGKHTGSAEVTMFDGGHFFINDHVEAVAELLAGCAQPEQTQ